MGLDHEICSDAIDTKLAKRHYLLIVDYFSFLL